ncbi:MAG TPA: metabolite traffic protein EboE [Solirubrobacteraceae bacterium]|nr:metabolite traffic protein EboE [Solirubrobacteraceae bacterium]
MTRWRHRDGSVVHIAYCTNVHPAEDLEGVLAQLERFADPLRQSLQSDRLGVGLWLAAPVARLLRREPDAVARLRDTLDRLGLEVVTFNGFPYRAFHAPVVKRAVYRPDWTRPERSEYTLDLAWLLARLLPDDVMEGSISTLPFGWRVGWTEQHAAAARAALATVALELERLGQVSGRRVRLAIEPEPGCAIETAEQAIAALHGLDPAWVGVCLDACHMAVQFEEPEVVKRSLQVAGVPVVKVQASAALRAALPGSTDLESFVEPRFLHQTRARAMTGVVGVDDLDEALAGGLPREREWRVHFHVPVHMDGGRTTQQDLRDLLACLLGGPQALTGHVELETYTWSVMPGVLRPADDAALVDGLTRELRWLAHELEHLGLREAA